MRIKDIGALTLALIIAASAFVFASCAKTGGDPAKTGDPDATVTASSDEGPEIYVDDSVREALEDYYALKEGDFSILEKYWNGSLSAKITAEGARLEKAVYGTGTYQYVVPPVITEERWDKLTAEAEEKSKDDPTFNFVLVKLQGFYSLIDLNVGEGGFRDGTFEQFADKFGFDISNVEKAYFCDPAVSDSRLRELEGYFTERFGYTIEDVRDASREAGIPDADEIGTVEPYFVFGYYDDGETLTYTSVEYSEEAVNKLESLCREYIDENGEPLCYGKYEYRITAVKEASYGDAFNEIRNDYKELTGDELHKIYKVTLEEKKIGETVAATGEYREFSPEEAVDTGFDEIFLCTTGNRKWEPEKIDFPWGGSARRALLLFVDIFND